LRLSFSLFSLAKLLRHRQPSLWHVTVPAHRVTTPAGIIVWLLQTAAKQPSIGPAHARVALTPAVITAFHASDFY
jgi:hypothetical protein